MHLLYVTSNDQKFEEACHVLSNWTLERVNLDLAEIQGSSDEIAYQKALDACKAVNKPVVVEDVSMYCDALKGLPGPYVKDFLNILGAEGLAELILKHTDHNATVVCTAAYCEPGGKPVVCSGGLEGTIVLPRGNLRHGKLSWNPIFLPDGHSKTMGELTIAEHAAISMRKIALQKLAKRIMEEHNVGS